MKYDYDEIKLQYENSFLEIEEKEKHFLESNKLYIVRLDGVGMTKRFKPYKFFFNRDFLFNIQNAFYDFCNHHSEQVLFGFHCNDEISLLIKTVKQDADNTYNRKEKLLSLFASEISVRFDQYCGKKPPETDPNFFGEKLNIFDARIFEVTKDQVVPYFCLRQAFGIEHALTRLKYKTGKEKNIEEALVLIKHPNILFGNLFKKNQKLTPFEFDKLTKKLRKIIFY